jgi:hypothetical protein
LQTYRNSWIHRINDASHFLREKKKFIKSQEEQLRKSRGKGIGTLIVKVVEASNLPIADISGNLLFVWESMVACDGCYFQAKVIPSVKLH